MYRGNTGLLRARLPKRRIFRLQRRRLGLRLVLWSAVVWFQLWHGPMTLPAYAADVGMIGDDDQTTASVQPAEAAKESLSDNVGAYFGINSGYALTDYVKQFGGHNNWDHGVGYLTLGAYTGYQFRQQLALEVGYQYVLSATAHNEDLAGAGSYSRVTPQIVYGVFKMTAPLHKRLDLFAKVGLAYVHQTVTQHGAGGSGAIARQQRTRAHMGGAFGAGLNYRFSQRWFADMSYMFVSGEFKVSQDQQSQLGYQIPSINLFMFSVG